MEELFFTYYGMDWVAMITALLSIYFIGDQKRYGFIFGIIAAIAWVFVNLVAHIWAGLLLNFILIALHSRGYLKWKKVK